MTRIRTRGDTAERRLYLLFFGGDGAFRRAEVPADFGDPATLPAETIVEMWRTAESIR
jgi:hypothetical protein